MSSASARDASEVGRRATSRRMSSIARSIAWEAWVRRAAGFVMLDVALALALAAAFLWQSNAQLPEGATTAGGWLLARGWTFRLDFAPPDPATLSYTVSSPDGTTFPFPVARVWGYVAPAAATLLSAEVLSLLSGTLETRRVRRRLRPLNELALTAEAIGSASDAAAAASAGKFANLEHAIAEASPDAPQVSTGDADLRSIEVALNALLRRMQEARSQQARFVSDASHELRTPIAVIQGYVNMLDRWGKTDEAVLDESIEALKAESAHMQELVEQLLFLARGDSGRQTLERTTFSLARLAAEVVGESTMIDGGHLYEPRLAGIPADGALLVGDRAMVKQAMRIMVQNAAKYSPAGSRVAVGVRMGGADGGTSGEVAFFVEDEGIGMTAADASHAFERFWRSDEARSAREGGTGLGLSIARWIVEAHEGRIEVLSRRGVGTRFTSWLPSGLPSGR